MGPREPGPAPDPDLDLMTAADVAAVLRCTPRTAARRLAAAGVPSIRVSQKLVYWRRAEVAAYLARLEGRVDPGAQRRVGRPALPAPVLAARDLTPDERSRRAERVAHLFKPRRPKRS